MGDVGAGFWFCRGLVVVLRGGGVPNLKQRKLKSLVSGKCFDGMSIRVGF